MREIKFRAWDEKEKCWVGGFAIHQNGMFSDWAGCKEVNGKCYADANWEQLKNIPHIKIMQYTGLKDKNGKEIYEGDVLKNDYGELWVVVWEGTGFMLALDGESKSIYSHNEYYFSSCEMIGNIYENPELLEGEE